MFWAEIWKMSDFFYMYPAIQQWRGIMISRWTSVCLSARPSVVRFSFLDDTWSKHQWIFTKLGMCIDTVEIWFELLMAKIRQIFTELSARDTPIFFIFVSGR